MQAEFDVRTGEAIASPCTIDLRIYETSLVDGRLFVKISASAPS